MSNTSLLAHRRVVGLRLIAVLSVLGVLGRGDSARAFSSWIDAGGGSYTDPSNWSPANVPDTSTEGAFFALNATYTVDFPTDVSVLLASVSQGTVTWDLNSSGTSRTYTLGSLTVNGDNAPTLLIEDGTVNAGNLQVANGSIDISDATIGFQAALNVSGGVLINGGQVVIRDVLRAGPVRVEDGGLVQLTSFADLDTGSLTIRNTGRVEFSGDEFNVNADLDIDGGTLQGGRVNLDSGRTITVQNGGSFTGVFDLHQGNTLSVTTGGMTSGTFVIAGTGSTGDGDIDQADFARLQRCHSGEGVPADPACLR